MVNILSITFQFSKSFARTAQRTGVIVMYGKYASEQDCKELGKKCIKNVNARSDASAIANPSIFLFLFRIMLQPSFAQCPKNAPMKNIGSLA